MVNLAISQNRVQQWLRSGRAVAAARAVNLLLVIWLAWQLAGLSWQLVSPDQAPVLQPQAQAPAPVRRDSGYDPRQIAGWHLFGVPGAERTARKPSPVDAPETRLKLTLRGVFSSEDKAQARAIIADPRGKEAHYKVGDPLPGGAKLADIYPDRIILERNGRFETLRLPREGDVGRGAGAVPATRQRRTSVAGSAQRNAALQRYRSEIKQNPASFLNYVRATPARQEGRFVGFRLQAGKRRGVLKELGLAPGDIVTGVNGVAIDNPAKGIEAMRALSQGQNVNVTLLRGGRELSLSFTLPAP